jgi:hypothetical protein
MTKPFVLSTLVLLAPLVANAGNFFGAGPFRGGSPLPSGTDGVYQAVATAPNVTGLFSWTIRDGVQTTAKENNSWVFFVDGQLLAGTTQANVSEGKVTGILDSGIQSGLPTSGNGTLTPPIVFVIPGNSGGGQFQGKINLKSPVAAFEGDGQIQGTPSRLDQIIYISDVPEFIFLDGTTTFSPVITEPVVIPGSTLQETKFDFRGTRLTTSTTSSTQQTSSTQN